jgi:phage-related holin
MCEPLLGMLLWHATGIRFATYFFIASCVISIVNGKVFVGVRLPALLEMQHCVLAANPR